MNIKRENTFGRAERTFWGDFPRIVRNADLGDLKKHSEYILAKSGYKKAAHKLIQVCLKKEVLEEIYPILSEKEASLVPVLAIENRGKNLIPLAMASYLSKEFHLPIETNILQHEKIFRTNKGSDFRLVFNPSFVGRVEKGRNYFLIDDTLTMGGTLASLHGYIKSHGGNVLGAFVMTAHEGSLQLPVQKEMLQKIDRKHGKELRNFWKDFSAYDINLLTQAEAGHLLKASSVQSIRERMKSAYEEYVHDFEAALIKE